MGLGPLGPLGPPGAAKNFIFTPGATRDRPLGTALPYDDGVDDHGDGDDDGGDRRQKCAPI